MYRTTRRLLATSYGKSLCLPKTGFAARAKKQTPDVRIEYNKQLYAHQETTRTTNGDFILHDGPPYANGSLHMGHFVNKIMKDTVNKYWLQQGKRVLFYPGWDCHGLPIEQKALAATSENNKELDVSAMTPSTIRAQAEVFAKDASTAQLNEFQSWGVMADWNKSYFTFDPEYEVEQLDIFYNMFKKGLIYRELKPVHWSPSCRTALAESELEYNEAHKSTAIFVAFPMKTTLPSNLSQYKNLSAVTWTTTPWTLVANKAMSFGSEIEYCVVTIRTNSNETTEQLDVDDDKFKGQYYIVAKDCIENIQNDTGYMLEIQPESYILGKDLAGSICYHPFIPNQESPLIPANHVTTDSGSGLVHTAPGHGMEDFVACHTFMEENPDLPSIAPFSAVDDKGCYTHEVTSLGIPGVDLEGQEVLGDGNNSILTMLANQSNCMLHMNNNYIHRYPYDWRSHKPIIFRATPQWFTRLNDIQISAVESLKNVKMIPAESALKRLTSFLLSRREWCISRQRSWGVPIPVFYKKNNDTSKKDDIICTQETIDHLSKIFLENNGSNSWFTLSIDELLPPSMRHESHLYYKSNETMDVWFDSGSSWKAALKPRGINTPVDMYLEGSDQHRGWFQSSLLTSIAVQEQSPYKCILSHGFVVDEHKKKMSKSVGNVIAPSDIIQGMDTPSSSSEQKKVQKDEKNKKIKGQKKKKVQRLQQYPLDVLRLWVASTDTSSDITLGPTVLAASAEFMHKIRITLKFLLGCLHDFKEENIVPYNELESFADQYMLYQLYDAEKKISHFFSEYEWNKAISILQPLIHNTISAFYLGVSKLSLYTDYENSLARRSRQTVLYHILGFLTRTMAPLTVEMAEEAYQTMPNELKILLSKDGKSSSINNNNTNNDSINKFETVFDCGWHQLPEEWNNNKLDDIFNDIFTLKTCINKLLEKARTEKLIGDSNDARVIIYLPTRSEIENMYIRDLLQTPRLNAPMLLQVSQLNIMEEIKQETEQESEWYYDDTCVLSVPSTIHASEEIGVSVRVMKAKGEKCQRCWNYFSELTAEEELCTKCNEIWENYDHQEE